MLPANGFRFIHQALLYLDGLMSDIRAAIRSLGRVPGMWATVALTLALGIGANSAIFSVVRGVLLRPLVNRGEDRLVYIQQGAPGTQVSDTSFSIPEISDITPNLKSLKDTCTFSTIDFSAQGLGPTREIHAGIVDGNYFTVMGLKPVLGRLLNKRDDGPSAPGAAVLTYQFWASAMHSDRSVIGKTIQLGSLMQNRAATVIGVLEPSIPYPANTDIIANIVTSPHHLSATMVQSRVHRMTDVFGRLAAGADLKSARAELQTVYAAMLAAHPDVYKPEYHFQINVRRLRDQINTEASPVLWLLLSASGLLFVITCANVANLILARTVRRESEIAMRGALGADAVVIRRWLLAEALVLCGSGSIAGVLVAVPMVAIIARYALRFSVRAADLTVDFTVLWVALGLAMLAALFLAFVPRLPSSTSSHNVPSTSGNARVTTRSRRRIRVFTVVQITASFLLLMGAGVLLDTLLSLQKAQPGFATSHVLVADLPLISDGRTPQQIAQFYEEARRRVSILPGVQGAAEGMMTPWRDSRFLSFTLQFAVQGERGSHNREASRARFRFVSPHYFGTLNIPIVQGREFTDADRKESQPVVIVSKSLAQRLFPGQDALNRQLKWTDPLIKFANISPEFQRIVGIAADVDDANIVPQPNVTIYQPFSQGPMYGATLLVRAQKDPHASVASVNKAIRDAAATQPFERPASLEDVRTEVLANNRVNAVMFGGFALLALAISVVGVAGVLAFSVSWRTREFAIRLAVGAHPRRILTSVLMDAGLTAAIGISIGGLLSWVASRIAGNYVAELHFPGPVPLLWSAALVTACALIASLAPAMRASRVDAIRALRFE